MMQKQVTVNPGESKRVTFTFTPTEARGYRATADGLSGTFVAYPVPQAEFEVSDLIVEPAEVYVNQPVTISVLVTNVGGKAGTYEVVCEVL